MTGRMRDKVREGFQSSMKQHETYERQKSGTDANYKREQGTEQRVNPEEESNGYGGATRTESGETQTNQKR